MFAQISTKSLVGHGFGPCFPIVCHEAVMNRQCSSYNPSLTSRQPPALGPGLSATRGWIMRFRVSCSVLAKERFAIIRECLSSKPQDQQLEDGDHAMSSMIQLAKLTTALSTLLCLTVPVG